MIKKQKLFVLGLLVVMLGLSGVVSSAEFDLGGAEIHFWQWYNILGAFEEDGRAEGRIEELEEKYNFTMVKQNFAPDQTDQFIARLMAGDANNDIWMIRQYLIPVLANQGVLFPINDFIREADYEGLPDFFINNLDNNSFMGNLFGFQHGINYPGGVHGVGWDKDMFEREGLPSLYDIYNEGNWTYDIFLEVARELTKDTTGDGINDQHGIGGNVVEWWYTTNGGQLFREIDGRIVFTFNEPEVCEAFLFERKLREAGVIGSNPGMAPTLLSLMSARIGTENYGIVPPPKGPNVDDHIFSIAGQNPDVLVLPISTNFAEEKVKIMHELWPPQELNEIVMNGIRNIAPDQESARVLIDGMNKISVARFILTDTLGFLNRGQELLLMAVRDILYRGRSPYVAFDEIAPAAQKDLDNIFNR